MQNLLQKLNNITVNLLPFILFTIFFSGNSLVQIYPQGCPLPGFLSAPRFSVGDYPYSIAAGDFNGDGNIDLATAN